MKVTALFTMIATAMLGTIFLNGCPQAEKDAYNTVIAAKAFTDSIKAKHPECTNPNVTTLCQTLNRAVAAKDALIDAVEVYCAGPDFAGGGACDPPKKGTPVYTQASAKLTAAMQLYSQAESDLKKAAGGKP